jgi:hypothetical protein
MVGWGWRHRSVFLAGSRVELRGVRRQDSHLAGYWLLYRRMVPTLAVFEGAFDNAEYPIQRQRLFKIVKRT